MGDRKKRKRWWSRAGDAVDDIGDVGEIVGGGCCLLELFSFSLLIGAAGLAPLLMR